MRNEQLEAAEVGEKSEEPAQAMTYEAALELIDDAREAWKETHANIEKWASFEDGDQWDAKDDEGLQLTYNIVPSFTNHASNVVKKNPPSIKIVAGNNGSEKVATIAATNRVSSPSASDRSEPAARTGPARAAVPAAPSPSQSRPATARPGVMVD